MRCLGTSGCDTFNIKLCPKWRLLGNLVSRLDDVEQSKIWLGRRNAAGAKFPAAASEAYGHKIPIPNPGPKASRRQLKGQDVVELGQGALGQGW